MPEAAHGRKMRRPQGRDGAGGSGLARLKDIGRSLGLSVTQVSRALGGHGDVSEATRRRVEAEAARLGYRPSAAGRALRSGRSGVVAMVVPHGLDPEAGDVLLEIVTGLSRAFARRDRQFVLHVLSEGEEALDAYGRLIEGGLIDGFVVIDPLVDDARVAYLERRGVPFAVHGRVEAAPRHPFFDIDNRAVGHALAAHLARLGHRRIALVDGPEGRPFARARRAGFDAALAEAGLRPDPRLVLNGPMTAPEGARAAARLMAGAGGAPPPSAIALGNAMLARGVLDGLARLKLSVPGDVSVAAHDDALPRFDAAAFAPPLTGTRAPLACAWPALAGALIGAIEGRPLAELQRVASPAFVERGSTATPRGG